MRIVFIHGFKASSKTNFFPWLKEELMRKGHEVVALDLPNPEAPAPEEWTKALLEGVGPVDDQTIIVAHSLGAAESLRFLEAAEARSTIKGLLMIAPPWMINNDMFRGFFMSELDFDVLMWKAKRFSIIHSRDDKVIPFDHAEKYAKVLHARLVERNEGEGHFQGERYPIILEEIERIANEEIVYAPGQTLDDDYAVLHNR